MEEPLISVIVINFNGEKHLKECFDSLNNLDYENLELIFVDNDSEDNSVNYIKNNYKNVNIIQLDKNYGFAKSNNIAASKAKGKFIVLLNNDTYVDKNWLKELVRVAKSSREIGIVGSKIYYYDNKDIINFAGGSCDKYGKSNHIGENKQDHKLLNKELDTFFACGAALLVKKELLNIIGLFDPLYFIYSEDLDLCWRAWIFGYKVVYAPKSFIYHKIGQIFRGITLKKKFLAERNLLRTLLKNYEIKNLIEILPVYIGRRIGMVLKLLIQRDRLTMIFLYSYVKAFIWNIYNIRSLIRNRRFIQINRKIDDNFLFKIMNKTNKIEQCLRNI